MIGYEFVTASMKSLDQLDVELLVLPFFSDERPLAGAAGLIDWRLCGALSRKLMAGYLEGQFGEKGMLAAPDKLRAEGLLLVGLGPSHELRRDRLEQACVLISDALREAKVATAALVLPGRGLDLVPALDAMQLWLESGSLGDELEELSIIERPEEHRALASLFDGLRRQSESPLP